jgi:hypothetical protein
MKNIFILSLFFFINIVVLAQKSTEILPNSITLPRLSTTQQNSIPPQQAGNIIYNADEKKLALHDGTNWNYLTANAAANGFTNFQVLFDDTNWTVPSGVNKIRVELWAGGNPGYILNSIGANFVCIGGRGSVYTSYELAVVPNEVLDIFLGRGGINSVNNYYIPATDSEIKRGTTVIASTSLGTYVFPTGLIKVVLGEKGGVADFAFQEVSTGTFRKIVRTGAGGGTYPLYNNGGKSATLEFSVPNGTLIGQSQAENDAIYGGGGACQSDYSFGGKGIVHIYY